MFTRIVVPLDGSTIAQAALPYALTLADAACGALTLLQAVPPLHVTWDYYVPYDATFEAEALAKTGSALDALAARLRTPTRQIETYPTVGNPAEEILSYTTRMERDLIAMATHGRGGIAHWAFGSVARKVLTAATVPTLIVRPTEAPPNPEQPATIRNILVPLDGSNLAAALPLVRALAPALGAQVTLVRAVAIPSLPYAVAPNILLQPEYFEGAAVEARVAAEAYWAQISADFTALGVTTTSLMPTGNAATAILVLLEDRIYDLIVMTTHGRTGVTRWTMGSVAERLIEASHTPILFLRSAGPAT